jgi:5'-deoxynucleotidase YfbR-like HD superfamily hydrolase
VGLALSVHDFVELVFKAEALKRISRTGWDIAGVQISPRESVAAHSWGTSFLAWVISAYLKKEGIQFDSSKVLQMALLHDIPECITSDIPHPAIGLGAEKLMAAKEVAEAGAVDTLFSTNPSLQVSTKQLLRELTEESSLESRIVLTCDVLDMLFHAISLERSGVKPVLLNEFFETGLKRIKSFGVSLGIETAERLYSEHRGFSP